MFGFVVHVAMRPAAIAIERDALANSLRRLLETHGLEGGGPWPRGGGPVADVALMVRRVGAQATDADRQLVVEWAARWASTASVAVGDLVDLSDGA